MSGPVQKLYPLELNYNERGCTPGDEGVKLVIICGNLRRPTSDSQNENKTEDLHDNDTHIPRSSKVLPAVQGNSEPFVVNKTANGRT